MPIFSFFECLSLNLRFKPVFLFRYDLVSLVLKSFKFEQWYKYLYKLLIFNKKSFIFLLFPLLFANIAILMTFLSVRFFKSMKKALILVVVSFFSMMALANSTKLAIDNMSLYADKTTAAPVLTQIKKHEKLNLLTMHYSGWSQVQTISGDRGWILSANLVDAAPDISGNTGVNTNSDLVDSLNKDILDLKAENKDLGLSKNKEIVQITTELETKIDGLKVENLELKSQLSQAGDSRSSFDLWLVGILSLILGLLIGFSLSKVKRRRDSFHTINRSY